MAEMLAMKLKTHLQVSLSCSTFVYEFRDKDLELTDLIVEETRRIVNLLNKGRLCNSRKPEMTAVNIQYTR